MHGDGQHLAYGTDPETRRWEIGEPSFDWRASGPAGCDYCFWIYNESHRLERSLVVYTWFDEVEARDCEGRPVDVVWLAESGVRWWRAFFAKGQPREEWFREGGQWTAQQRQGEARDRGVPPIWSERPASL
jgi:hypothetical protein